MVDPLGPTSVSRTAAIRAAERRDPGQGGVPPKHMAQAQRLAARLAAEGAPVDLGRIEMLRQAISDNSLVIDPRAIARRLKEWA